MERFSKNKRKFLYSCHGQSLLEAILAMAVFSMLVAGMAALVLGGGEGLMQGGEQTKAAALAQEGLEAVRAIKDGAWNKLIYNQSQVETSNGQWIFSGEGTSQQIGPYTRVISFDDVCRDGSQNIVACPGEYTDVHTKKVMVAVSWEARPGKSSTIQRVVYLTNWNSKEWKEDTTADFIDGVFNSTQISALGDGDGAVTLEEL